MTREDRDRPRVTTFYLRENDMEERSWVFVPERERFRRGQGIGDFACH